MNALFRIADEQAEAVEFTISAEAPYLGIPLKDLRLRAGTILAVIMRKGDIIIPEGTSTIELGDTIILISSDNVIQTLNDVFTPRQPLFQMEGE